MLPTSYSAEDGPTAKVDLVQNATSGEAEEAWLRWVYDNQHLRAQVLGEGRVTGPGQFCIADIRLCVSGKELMQGERMEREDI